MFLPADPPTLQERLRLLAAANRSAEVRQAVRERCRQDPAWFTNFALWTFDPRPEAKPHDLPFILWDFQVMLMRWLEERYRNNQDGLIDKSRDMGVTWVTLAWILHKWLFEPGFAALVGSRKEDLVDNRTWDSHFGKLEYMLRRIPGWMLPAGFDFGRHRQFLKLVNPENGNYVVGESANAQFSRQGRYSVVFFDEAAFWPDFASAWRAAGSATNCRIAVSTPNRMNTFGRMVHSGQYPHLRIHWRMHPRKDDQWYEKQKARYTAEDLAQEIDISYAGSMTGLVYPSWVDVPKGIYPYVPGWPVFTSWDFGVADPTAIIWWQKDPVSKRVRMLDCYSNQGKPIDFYVPFVLGYIPSDWPYEYTAQEREKIAIHGTWGQPVNYGDPAGSQRSADTARSVIDRLREFGIAIVTNPRANDFRTRKTETELGLRNLEVHVDPGNVIDCSPVDEAMLNARFPDVNPDSQRISALSKPIHNWTSHYRSAVEYFFVNQPSFRAISRPEPTRRRMAYDVW